MARARKALWAALGGAASAVLAVVPPDTTEWRAASIVAAVLTALGVYVLPNAPRQ